MRSLIAAALVLASVAGASADKVRVPEQFRGTWCPNVDNVDDSLKTFRRASPRACKGTSERVTVRADGYSENEEGTECKVLEVVPMKPMKPGQNDFRLIFGCSFDGGHIIQDLYMWRAQELLGIQQVPGNEEVR